jgi:hypothetical protein
MLEATPATRRALLIANGEYHHPELRSLDAPVTDIQALGKLLERDDIGGYHVELSLNETKSRIERRIDQLLTDSERRDVALILFAGHGIKHENGQLYFASIDTEPEYLGSTAISANWLMQQMQASTVRRQIVMLDCCFGGAVARGVVWRGGGRVESGKYLEVPNLAHEGRGQVIVTSADATQFALEGGSLTGSLSMSHFMRALVDGLDSGNADRQPQDGLITIDELTDYLVTRLKELGSPQRPTKWVFGQISGDLVFARNPRALWHKPSEAEFTTKITIGDLSLQSSSWRAPWHDHVAGERGFPDERVYRIDVIVDAAGEMLDRISKVVYFMPPAWDTSPTVKTNRQDRFGLKELSWANVNVRVQVYERSEREPIELATFVHLEESGERLIV